MRPPIKKTCPECGGTGKGERNPVITWEERTPLCKKCLGKKEVYNYLTPQQYIEWMRTEGGEPGYIMDDETPVWSGPDCECINRWEMDTYQNNYYADKDNVVIVIRLLEGQPKPDDSWRPE